MKALQFLKNLSIREITIVNLEYTSYNGFRFNLLKIDIQGKEKSFEGDLIGLYVSDTYILICLLFIEIEIKSPIK
jgi:hypothetical protein